MVTVAHGTSAAAFVAGGVQDACDDACSICLESFVEEDPATRTTCNHEYHLQCILEWAQRSKECPMCWRSLSLEDPDSQSYLPASDQERVLSQQRSTVSHQQSALDGPDLLSALRIALYLDLEDDVDFEDDRILYLAAAENRASRVPHVGRREESEHPQHIIVPVNSNTTSTHLSRTSVASAGDVSLQSTMSSPADVSPEVVTVPAAPGPSTSGHMHGRLITGPIGGGRELDRGSLESRSSPRQAPVEHHVDKSQPGTSSSEPASETFKSRMAKTMRGFQERLRVANSATADRASRANASIVRALDQNKGSSSAPNSRRM